MKKLLKLLTISTLFLQFYSIPAQAGWQYTEWEMSPDEVIAASGNKIENKFYNEYSTSKTLGRSLKTKYTTHNEDFSVSFVFNKEDKLDTVKVSLDEKSKCQWLLTTMYNIYGNALDKKSDASEKKGNRFWVSTWRDLEHNNLVNFFTDITAAPKPPIICEVSYKQLKRPNERGGL